MGIGVKALVADHDLFLIGYGIPDATEEQVSRAAMRIAEGSWLKNPVILILDEATANVDPFTEAQLQEGLGKPL